MMPAGSADAAALSAIFMGGAGKKIVQHSMQQTLPREVALGRDQSQALIVRLRDPQGQPPHAATRLRKGNRDGRW